MGIFSRSSDSDADTGAGTGPAGGDVSQPQGDGPVTLDERTEPGGQGSPDTNQGKTEPLSPTPDHPQPLTVPDLADMSVGAADPQAPSHPAAGELSPPGSYGGGGATGRAPLGLGGPGARPHETRPDVDTTTSTGRAPGPEQPVSRSSGEAHRAGGLNGRTPDGEFDRDRRRGRRDPDGSVRSGLGARAVERPRRHRRRPRAR